MSSADARFAPRLTSAGLVFLLLTLAACADAESDRQESDAATDTVESMTDSSTTTNTQITGPTGETTLGSTGQDTTEPDGPCVMQEGGGRCLVETIAQAVSRNTAFADLDGDGDLDAASVLPDVPAKVWSFVNEAGQFAAPTEIPFTAPPTNAGTTASFGSLIVATGSTADRLLTQGTYGSLGDVRADLWLSGSDGFTRLYAPTSTPSTGPWLADFDGDGDDDIVLAPTAGSLDPLAVYPCTSTGCTESASAGTSGTPVGPWTILGADVDADGRDELLVYARDGAGPNATSFVTVVRATGGSVEVGPPITLGAGLSPFFVQAHDLNADGRQDLAVVRDEGDPTSDSGGAQVLVFFADADGFSAGPTISAPLRITGLAFGDVTGDGQTDAIMRVTDSPAIVVSQGPDFAAGPTYALSSVATGLSGQAIGRFPIAVSDVDANGTVDILTVVETAQAPALAVLRAFD